MITIYKIIDNRQLLPYIERGGSMDIKLGDVIYYRKDEDCYNTIGIIVGKVTDTKFVVIRCGHHIIEGKVEMKHPPEIMEISKFTLLRPTIKSYHLPELEGVEQ